MVKKARLKFTIDELYRYIRSRTTAGKTRYYTKTKPVLAIITIKKTPHRYQSGASIRPWLNKKGIVPVYEKDYGMASTVRFIMSDELLLEYCREHARGYTHRKRSRRTSLIMRKAAKEHWHRKKVDATSTKSQVNLILTDTGRSEQILSIYGYSFKDILRDVERFVLAKYGSVKGVNILEKNKMSTNT